MEICSISFLFPILLLSTVFPFLPSLFWRRLVLGATNLVCIAILLPGWTAAGIFFLIVLSGYGMGLLLRRHPRRWILAAYCLGFVVVFLFLKHYSFLELIFPANLVHLGITIVGLSYTLFRQIHFLIDQYQGSDDPLDLWAYLNFQLNIFSLVSGPITRYPDFREDWDSLLPRWECRHDLLMTYGRIWLGVVKVLVLGVLFYHYYLFSRPLWTPGAEDAGRFHMIRTLYLFYFYPIYIYFNFSGYCDIVIGCGRLFGLRVPENFNNPFLSRNMIEFWSRWHISLGAWIKDYLYTPMLKGVLTRFPKRGGDLAFACYFVAFFLAGVWHGSTWNFVAYGLLQGLGVSVAKLWEMFLLRRLGRDGHTSYLASRPIRWAAVGVNFHYFCFTCLVFGLNFPALRQLGRTLGLLS
jgi:D-alanyl-lipoteichoic acid acyltransferase DltB (MBOAT superfamily)